MPQRISVVENILSANDRLAAENRQRLEEAGVFSLNIMASPGAGKTSLVERTVRLLAGRLRLAVIDGDIVEAPLQPAHEMLKQQVASRPKEPTVTPIQTYDQDLAIDPRDEEVRRQRRRAALKT